jgi:hypothetical protein
MKSKRKIKDKGERKKDKENSRKLHPFIHSFAFILLPLSFRCGAIRLIIVRLKT